MFILTELGREVLYMPEVALEAFGATIRNFTDLAEEGVRRLIHATRMGIMRGPQAEYTSLQSEDGSPEWASRNSFYMLPDTGLWQAKFAPRSDAKFGNWLIVSALTSGLFSSSPTDGQAPHL